MNWIKKHKTNIILTFMSIIVSLIVVDTALYFTRYKYPIYRLNYPPFYFVKDLEFGYDIAQNFATSTHFFRDDAFLIWSNNIGCFDTNYIGETPYIYMAGDSLTWSFAPFNDTWGRKIETLVGIRTVKCGVVGHGTKQELIKASRNFKRFSYPNLIIVGYTAYNDFDDDANFPQHTVYNGYMVKNQAKRGVTEAEAKEKYANFYKYCSFNKPSIPIIASVRCFITNHSVMFNLFKSDIRGKIDLLFPKLALKFGEIGFLAQQETSPVDKSNAEYKKHLDNILGFKKIAEEKNSKLLFVLAPYDNERVKLFLDKKNIAYIDLNPIFDTYSKVKPLIWPKDGHYNIAGNHLVGFVVSKFIIENNFIEVDNKIKRIEKINMQIKNEFGGVF